MAIKNIALRAFAVTVAYTSIFMLTIGAILISLVVGDWIYLKTDNLIVAWTIGITVMLGFLGTLGAGVGVWLWLRGPTSEAEVKDRHDTIDRVIFDMEHGHKD